MPPCMNDSPRSRIDIFQIAESMYDGTNDDNNIPAGYTYLGQFIIHDLSFDPTSMNERAFDPEYLWNFRTPALDLDSLYGAGPTVQPYLYQEGSSGFASKFYLPSMVKNSSEDTSYQNLPRLGKIAVIADPRNDENIIISQLHAAFLRFHNALVDKEKFKANASDSEANLFKKAQKIVRWSYQWIVLFDYLPRIIDINNWQGLDEYREEELSKLNAIELHQKKIQLIKDIISSKTPKKYFDWRNEPFIPLEFSAAAFRFGHSQVKTTYLFNLDPSYQKLQEGVFQSLFATKTEQPFRVDMRLFFSNDIEERNVNHSIDTKIAMSLKNIPGRKSNDDSGRIAFLQLIKELKGLKKQLSRKVTPAETGQPIEQLLNSWLDELQNTDVKKFILDASLRIQEDNVAELNLARAILLGLPSGQDVARAMGIKSPLTIETDNFPNHLRDNTPLWYYILYEAQTSTKGQTLGPIGSQIVCEVLIGLILADKSSFINQHPKWIPEDADGVEAPQFSMLDLLRIAGLVSSPTP